jgi:para-nitrobenzyl esterase
MTTSQSIVQLRAGRVRGLREDGVEVFRGVPYARPPIGPLRFRAPLECEPWNGVREATAAAPIAPQLSTPLEAMEGRMELPQSEDCLTLNVWTPASDGGRRPVMVWIHGGGYMNGTGAAEWFDGTSFAASHGIVLVTINYRLNVFGYLHLAELAPGEAGSGNCGLLDQIAALRWVHNNIAAFGGDPDNVTVFGESAGAFSVGIILGTPGAAGLMHRAILQSGAAAHVISTERATTIATEVITELGFRPDERGIAEMRQLSTDQVLAAFGAVAQRHPPDGGSEDMALMIAPVVDGFVLPVEPMTAIRQGASAGIPVMIGTDLNEMEIMRLLDESFYDLDDDEVARRCAKVFGDLATRALALYRGPTRGMTGNAWTAVDTDRTFLIPAIELAEVRAATGGATWMYLFTWTTTAFGGRMGAVHTLEIPFVFNTLDRGAAPELTGGPPDHARPLAGRMHRTWAQFARHGDPNHDGLPQWEVYEPERRATMIFDVECVVEHDAQRDRRLLWQERAARPATD